MNQSSTSLEVEWNTTLPAFLTYGDEKRGFKIDFQRAGDTEVKSILVCNSSSYLFSDLMVFTNYCSSVVSFNNDKIDTKVDNFKCVFTDEEGNNNICIHPCFFFLRSSYVYRPMYIYDMFRYRLKAIFFMFIVEKKIELSIS